MRDAINHLAPALPWLGYCLLSICFGALFIGYCPNPETMAMFFCSVLFSAAMCLFAGIHAVAKRDRKWGKYVK